MCVYCKGIPTYALGEFPPKSHMIGFLPSGRLGHVMNCPALTLQAATVHIFLPNRSNRPCRYCLLYTSDAADEEDSVDLGGRRIIKKKKQRTEMKVEVCK
eukprot:TRINITY_DN50417_c0_g1_i1.p1 TRINITY_DN50417_c0_g1~~TRINITY_DN50417_c0_g1_i1.p1  ORF type:complete len:100 (+),score=4.92 TRINITY_DN50417_c0_g1_i1:150-449(+)